MLRYNSACTEPGLYFALLVHNARDEIYLSLEGLPIVQVRDYTSLLSKSPNTKDLFWLNCLSRCSWSEVEKCKKLCPAEVETMRNRLEMLKAITTLQKTSGLTDLGVVYPKIIHDQAKNVSVLIFVRPAPEVQNFPVALSILRPNSLGRAQSKLENNCPLLLEELRPALAYSKSLQAELEPGLYLFFIKTMCDLQSLYIATSREKACLPVCERLRENAFVGCDEWAGLKSCARGSLKESDCGLAAGIGKTLEALAEKYPGLGGENGVM